MYVPLADEVDVMDAALMGVMAVTVMTAVGR
jgi:hypothetical protein